MKKFTLASMTTAAILGVSIFSIPLSAQIIEKITGAPSGEAIHLVNFDVPSGQQLTVHLKGLFGKGTGPSCQYSKTLDGGSFSVEDGRMMGINGPGLSRILGSGYTCGKLDFEVPAFGTTASDKFSLIWDKTFQQYTDTIPHQSTVTLEAQANH